MDLLTPNRLMLGRNNERSPAGPLCASNDSDKIIEQNANIIKAWFECWLVSHVPKLMEQLKWFSSDRDLKAGDVVLHIGFSIKDRIINQARAYGFTVNFRIRTIYLPRTSLLPTIKIMLLPAVYRNKIRLVDDEQRTGDKGDGNRSVRWYLC